MSDTVGLLNDLEKLLRNPICEDSGQCHWCQTCLAQIGQHRPECEWVRITTTLNALMATP